MKTTMSLGRLAMILMLIIASNKLGAQTWQPLNTNTTEDLKTLFFLNSNIGWAGGANGTIIKTTDGGVSWDTTINTPITETIRSVFFINSNTGWAAGNNGKVLKSIDGGINWTQQTSPIISQQINCIKFIDANKGWHVASGGLVCKTTNGGLNWTFANTNFGGFSAWGLSIIDPLNIWASGSTHMVNKNLTDSTWNPACTVSVAGATTFDDIDFIDIDTGYTVGGIGISSGVIFKTYTGSNSNCNWIPEACPVSVELLSVDMLSSQLGWSCGRLGNIIHFDGNSWNSEFSGTTSNLWQVMFVNDTTGWIAGDVGTVLKYQPAVSNGPLTVMSPNGSEVFQIGSSQSIIWSGNGSSTVNIEYSTNNGANWLNVANNISGTSYSWNVPAPSSLQALVRIVDASNPSIADTSDTLFYIQPVPQGDDYAVLMTATSSNSPAQIVLNWNANPNALTCTLDRKLKSDVNWTFVGNIPVNTNTYTDFNVNIGEAWEYRVTTTTPQLTAFGYIYAGLEYPETDFRGKILLLIDQNFASSIATEIDQFELDLIGDGYRVTKQIVDPLIGVVGIKNIILQEYANDTLLSSVLTIGHLPAPYSGNFAPDGHSERVGAQPADGYYGDIDFAWTDTSVITSNIGTIHTPNVIGDGKFDHSTFPSSIELQVGRIDMNDMTGFSLSETGLLQQYLNKDHDFRLKNFQPGQRALMNTTMDAQLPTVSAAAWRSYSAMFGNGIKELNNCNTGCTEFIDSLNSGSYLWAHMAGGGSDTSMSNDVFTSGQCISSPINTVFMQMYGSYFVEWYKGGISTLHNHLLRAPLASNGTTLASVWSGKAPYWHFHHMALGETIGYSTVTNQNNLTTYDPGNIPLQKGVHMCLMGDPTLKMHIVAPVSNLTAVVGSGGVSVDLSWTASPDNNIVGYNIYRANNIHGTFVKLNTVYITSTSYMDLTPLAGNSVYMVRAVKLENRSSASYYNLSTGIIDSVFTTLGDPSILDESFSIYPNPTADVLNFSMELEKIEVFNAYGQLVLTNILNAKSISVEHLANGIYFIRSGNINKKFIVKH